MRQAFLHRISFRGTGLYIAAALYLSTLPAAAQFSPGDLSRAHQKLDGSQNCTQCHEVGHTISGAKCLSCHEEIKVFLDKRRGFHGSTRAKECVDCHKEHLGRESKTMLFDEKTFDHAQTGFLLNGAHGKLQCNSCHTGKNLRDPVVAKKIADFPHSTYLGLNAACATCHKDPHQGKFNQDCASCHNTTHWSGVKSFDHTKARFPLEGKHLQVECARCHASMGTKVVNQEVNFQTKSFTDCTPCHNSPHKAKFAGQECKTCHSPDGWDKAMTKPFDHNQTQYKLIGRHTTVRCDQCHHLGAKTEFAAVFHLSFKKCTDCHQDKHNGEFLRSYGNRCDACHSEHAYKPSNFTPVRHAQTRFPLQGAHMAVLCASCHPGKEGAGPVFHFASIRCESCHKDVHRGQFAEKMKDASCASCHTTDRWSMASFDHSTTAFPLIGKHAAAACEDCHKTPRNDAKTTQFKKVSAECESCHKDIHQGQFATEGKTPCSQCHTAERWATLVFDHNKQSAFPLSGAHAKVACRACHRQESNGSVSFIRFKPVSAKCATCHQEGTAR